MSHGFLPRTDGALLAWARNFIKIAGPAPETFGLTEQQITDFSAALDSFADALRLCNPNIRNRVAVVAKNAARDALKVQARSLNNIVQGNLNVSDAQKVDLGLSVRGSRATTPAPENAPSLSIDSVRHNTVSLSLRQAGTDTGLRGRPRGVSGAMVFSFVGEKPPGEIDGWKYEAITAKTDLAIRFPASLAIGTKVWLIAMWFSHRKETGPASAPVGTNLQGGGVDVSSMRLAA